MKDSKDNLIFFCDERKRRDVSREKGIKVNHKYCKTVVFDVAS